MSAAPSIRSEALPQAKALTHGDFRRRKLRVDSAPGSLRPLRAEVFHAAGELFDCPSALAAADAAAQDDELAARFACAPENEHYLRRLPDGRKVPLEHEEQVRQAVGKLAREGRLPAHPGMRRSAIVQVVAAAASADQGAGGRASTAAIAYLADLSVRHTRDVLKYAVTIGLMDRIRCDRASDWAGAPLTAYRDRRGIWFVHLAPREMARKMSDDDLLELAAKGERSTGREAPVRSWRQVSSDAPPAAPASVGAQPAGPSSRDPVPSKAAPEPPPPAFEEDLGPALGRLPRLLAELGHVTRKGIVLDPRDVADLGMRSPPDGAGLPAEMVLLTIEEMIGKIRSGKTYASARDPFGWTKDALRRRLIRFFGQKRADLDVQRADAEREAEKEREAEDFARQRRGAVPRPEAEAAVEAGTNDAGDDEARREDGWGGELGDVAEEAPPSCNAAPLTLMPTGDVIFDRAAAETRAAFAFTFDPSFALVQFDGLAEGVLSLRFVNEFAVDLITAKLLPTLTAKITEQTGRRVTVQPIVDPNLSCALVRAPDEPAVRGPPT